MKIKEHKNNINTTKLQILEAEEFEKDDDSNGHIDLIYSMANMRSLNYELEYMDRL